MRRNRAMAKNAALLAASVMVWCGGANATPSCQGTYAATPLQPLPERVVLDLDLHDRSKRSLVLADLASVIFAQVCPFHRAATPVKVCSAVG